VTFDLKSRWKRLGKLDKVFTFLLLLYLLLLVLASGSIFTLLLQFLVIVLGAWIVLRLALVAVRKAIWRLRNRLLVAYVLIAVVPILLIVTLFGLSTYLLASQIAVYLARSELDRRITSMQSVTESLILADPALRSEAMRQVAAIYRQRFPDLILMIGDHGSILQWPENAALGMPPYVQGNVSGIAEREGHYYAWSHVGMGGMQFLAATPLTPRYLSEMVSGLGEIFLFRVQRHNGRTELLPTRRDAGGGTLPPAVNRLDLDWSWGSVVPTIDHVDPDAGYFVLLLVHTRLSAVLQVIFSRKVDELGGLVPFLFFFVGAFFVVEMIALVIGVSLTRTITGAVHSLYGGTQRVMKGDFSSRIAISGRDQLTDLGRSFNTMSENLEKLLAVAKEKERLQAELEIASEVQAQLYPKTIPSVRTLRVTGLCEPARMVSGDYYDYQNLSDNRLAIAIGDVAGKGISAALLMATIQSAMRMELRSSLEMAAPSHVPLNGHRLSTARMVTELNQQLHATTAPEKFATFCIALYDDDSGVITYTNAGHLPPILIRNGGATRLDVNGTVVGAFPRSQYDESKIQLLSGDLLIWYTDGITEPENEYGEMFGEERLIELVAKNAASDDRKIIDTVMQAVRQWTGLPELSDDMTMLLARKQ